MRYKCSCGNDDSIGGVVDGKTGMFTCSVCLTKKKVYTKEHKENEILEPFSPPLKQIVSVVLLEKETKKPKKKVI
jgi:hypothetical protein